MKAWLKEQWARLTVVAGATVMTALLTVNQPRWISIVLEACVWFVVGACWWIL